ncbi:MAG: glycosyltransferase [Cyanobacteria bacterium]|nr:glycosyltransferase [Cyanobacteriota bacterium]MDW8201029.1 glycosyltransferase [Cyanobacteriota bacterium SKYGB_h_bin112]
MTTTHPLTTNPIVSVVIEGYNESRDQGTANNTMLALQHQDYPHDRIEIILVGSSVQVEEWQAAYADPAPFLAVKAVAADGALYYALKNQGATVATGDIIVFTDSDVYPQPRWVSAIVERIQAGADVSVGISLFKSAHSWRGDAPLRQIAVCLTFGYILGKIRHYRPGQLPDMEVRGFMDHNLAMRTDVFRQCQYQTEFGRVIASPLLFRKLTQAGFIIALHPQQQIVHYFAWWYWLKKLHFRYGYEVYHLRRLDPNYPNQWITRTGILEPVVTMIWHMILDVPRWFRFSRLLDMHPLKRWGLLPVLIGLSGLARGAEMLGIVCTMISPRAMKQWAETV